jgi:hypothetical protein
VGPKTGVDDVERRNILPLPGLELRTLGRPAHCQSLYECAIPPPPKKKHYNLDNLNEVDTRNVKTINGTRHGLKPVALSTGVDVTACRDQPAV